MKILSLGYYLFLSHFRDKKDFFLQIISPIVLIMILGTALSGNFYTSNFDVDVAYVIEEENEISVLFEKTIQDMSDEMFVFHQLDNTIDRKELILNGQIDAVLVFKEDRNVELINGSNSEIESMIVSQLMDTFNQQMVLNELGFNQSYDYHPLREHSVKTQGKKPRAIDYYAVTMLAMYMLYGTSYGAYSTASYILDENGERIRSTGITFFEHFMGILIGSLATVFIQGMTIVVFTKYAFNVMWGNSMIFITFTVFTFALFTVALGMLITVLFKDKYKGIGLLNTLVPILTLFSGGFIPMSNSKFSFLSYITPNYHFHNILFNYSFYGGDHVIRRSMYVLWGMILLCFIIVAMMKDRRLA